MQVLGAREFQEAVKTVGPKVSTFKLNGSCQGLESRFLRFTGTVTLVGLRF